MSINLLGTKIGMTQIFDNYGSAIPVTVLQLGPCVITQIKNIASDGYLAIQIGYCKNKKQTLTKPEIGHLNKSGNSSLRYLQEFKVQSTSNFQVGQVITADQLQVGNFLKVSGVSTGKGFTGYHKRHHFSRGPMTHGSKNHRQPGSIGAGTTPGRVFPGKKMAGHMGHKQVSIQNLQIIDIYPNKDMILVKGSVPGKPGSLISITQK